MRIGTPHLGSSGSLDCGFSPRPTFSRFDIQCDALQTFKGEAVKQRHIFEPATAILGEEVAQDLPASVHISLHAHEHGAPICGGQVGFGHHAAD